MKKHTGTARRHGQADHRSRHHEPLGLLLGQGRAELLLAADPRSALRARLSRRHEVAHLRELNHSPKFWKIIYELCPRTEEAETWLKPHGSDLHRFG